MMRKIFLGCIAILLLSACDDSTMDLGYSIVPTQDELTITAETFSVPSHTIVVDSVLARTGTGYLGKYRDPETGAYITQNFLSQINMLEGIVLDSIENMHKEDGKVVADSCFIRLFLNGFYGDSLNLMKMTCYELAKPIDESANLYTNFNIEDPQAGYIRADGMKAERAWVVDDLNYSDTVRADAYGRFIISPLNHQYTDRNGRKYTNYGSYLLQTYYEHPEYYKNAYEFNHHVCPGFYFKTTNGIGTVAKISLSDISIYYRYLIQKYDSVQKKMVDTLSTRAVIFYGTNEVRQITQINNDKSRLKELAEDNTCTYLKTPAGLFTEITLPIDEIFKGHENDSLNIMELTLERYNNKTLGQKFSQGPPMSVMLIQKENIMNFFEKSGIIDNETTFLATLSTDYNTYTFANIAQLATAMYNEKKAGKVSEDWNKAIIIPVSVWNENSVSHLMEMSSTRLVGGSENPISPIQVKVTYSSFKK